MSSISGVSESSSVGKTFMIDGKKATVGYGPGEFPPVPDGAPPPSWWPKNSDINEAVLTQRDQAGAKKAVGLC